MTVNTTDWPAGHFEAHRAHLKSVAYRMLARDVIAQARRFAPLGRFARRVLINDGPGFLVARDGEPIALMAVTIRNGKLAEMDVLSDPIASGSWTSAP